MPSPSPTGSSPIRTPVRFPCRSRPGEFDRRDGLDVRMLANQFVCGRQALCTTGNEFSRQRGRVGRLKHYEREEPGRDFALERDRPFVRVVIANLAKTLERFIIARGQPGRPSLAPLGPSVLRLCPDHFADVGCCCLTTAEAAPEVRT